jgi:tight adherence protein C
MTASVLAGGLVGLGLFLLVLGLVQQKPSLSAVLVQFDWGAGQDDRAQGASLAGGAAGWRAHLGRSVLAGLRSAGIELSSLREDLRVIDRSVESLCASKALLVAGAGLAPPAAAALLALAGLSVGVLFPVWLSVTLAVAGAIVPDIRVRAEAARRRRSFRHAVGVYLTQVAISLAGGAAPEEALHKTLGVSRGWALARLAAALDRARLAGRRRGSRLASSARSSGSVSLASWRPA